MQTYIKNPRMLQKGYTAYFDILSFVKTTTKNAEFKKVYSKESMRNNKHDKI